MGHPSPTFDQYAERFWSRVDKSGDCWIWQGGTGHWGYGFFVAKALRAQMGYREQLAHRWAWIFTHGPIAKGLVVRHACDNPPCVNPEHLLLGTQADNVRDRDERQRRRPGFNRGSTNGKAVLTEDDVRRIRTDYVPGSPTCGQRALASRFGVSQATISMAVLRKTWAHLD